MKLNPIKALESVKNLCPYLSKQATLSHNLLISNAVKCPYMKSMNFVDPNHPVSLESISEKLMNPLNFLDIDGLKPSHKSVLDGQLAESIKKLKDEGRYRVFTRILRERGNFPQATEFMTGDQKKITVWCSNDYLGMGQHPEVLKAMHETLDNHGSDRKSTRLNSS